MSVADGLLTAAVFGDPRPRSLSFHRSSRLCDMEREGFILFQIGIILRDIVRQVIEKSSEIWLLGDD